MTRMVYCARLKQQAEALKEPPHPGPLGQRIYDHVSREGWQQWLEQLHMLMNEHRLNTSDAEHMKLIEQHMESFFFKPEAS